MKVTDAIYAVCHRRYERLIVNGLTDTEAGIIVADYLTHLKDTWKDNPYVINYINTLHEAYTQKI